MAFALIAGCASTSAAPAFNDVAAKVEQQGGHRVRWEQNTEEDAETTEAIDRLPSGELTAEAAVAVALLGSPHLRATFEELSIAQADLVQAGLLKNPVFSLGQTAWEAEHLEPNLFASVEQDFLDLLTMPMRKRVAATELEATKLEVGDEVLKLAAEVRSAFFTVQAAEQVTAMQRLVHEAAQASADMAKRQYEAGNMNDLAFSSEQALAAQTGLDLRRSEGSAAVAREHLNKLMGAWGARTSWRTSARLPELPLEDMPLQRLESLAVAKRLDVNGARREVQSLGYALTLAKTTRWTGVVNVNVEAGRLSHTGRVSFGPSVALEIPLFDQRQASIARLEAYKRKAENHLQALSIEVRADVRSAQARVATARAVAEGYGKVLVPLRERIVAFSQEQYDAMLLGVYQLLQAKQNEFGTYREYIEALRDYWIARSDLERAVGTRLGASPSALARPRVPDASKPPGPATSSPPAGGPHAH